MKLKNHAQYLVIIICLFISLVPHCQDYSQTTTIKNYNAFKQDIKNKKLSSNKLNQLDLDSQKLIKEFQNCEKQAESKISELAEIREIDALNQNKDTGEPAEDAEQKGTSTINNQIDEYKKRLIECRLKKSSVEEARVKLLVLKRKQWIDGLTVKHHVWNFITTSNIDIDTSEISDIIPLSRNAIILLILTLGFYFFMWFKCKDFYLESPIKTNNISYFKSTFKTLIKIHLVPILMSVCFWYLMDSPLNLTLLLVVFGLLIRDACLLISIKMLVSKEKNSVFNTFIYFSTTFIIFSAYVWQALDYKNVNANHWLDNNSLLITPAFLITTAIFGFSCYFFYQLLSTYKDRFLPLMLTIFSLVILVLFSISYAQAAQYLLVISMSLFMVHMSLKIINSLRKILLRQRIAQLKIIEKEQEKEPASYSFPFWVSLMTSLTSGFVALAFLSWVGGGSSEAYRQLSFFYKEGFDIGSVRFVPSDVFTALVIMIIFIILLIRVRHGIEYQWFSKSRLRKSSREVFSMMVWYLGITIITLIGLSVAGFNISNLAIIAGALSVGIGFGLQNIVSNFVSGLILLFERPVKRGDWVEVGSTVGFIEKVKIRATRIKTFDNADILVPNSELLSHHVTNWTLSNSIGRVIVKVGVAYGTDTQKVKSILFDIAQENSQVINYNPYKTKVIFKEFGDNSLNFELRVMIRDIKKFLDVHSDLNFAIDDAFRKAGISIPFPQRDLHLVNTVPFDIKGQKQKQKQVQEQESTNNQGQEKSDAKENKPTSEN